MSVHIVGSEEWKEWNDRSEGETVCFLCGEVLKDSEKVIHWMGSGGPKIVGLPFVPENFAKLEALDNLGKRSGGFAPALHIYFHTDCVPSFCFRLLRDWEEVKWGRK